MAKKKKAIVCRPAKRKALKRRKAVAKIVRAGLVDLMPRKPAPAFASMLKAAAAKIPSDLPGYGGDRGSSWIKEGRYIMRGGSIAIVTGPMKINFGLNNAFTWHGWKGHLEGHPHGEGLCWSLTGARSDAAPAHEHDIVKRHKTQAKGKT